MKITKERLQRIIKEEIEAAVDEGMFSKAKAKMGFGNKKLTEAMIKIWKLHDDVKKVVEELENTDKQGDNASYATGQTVAGKKEGYWSMDLEEAHRNLLFYMKKAAQLVAEHGLDSSQKIRWKEIPTKVGALADRLAEWTKVAVGREDGEAAAKAKEEEMASRRREFLAAQDAASRERSRKRGSKDVGLHDPWV